MTLPLKIVFTGSADCLQEAAPKVGGRLDVTFADAICEVAETQTTYITDELH